MNRKIVVSVLVVLTLVVGIYYISLPGPVEKIDDGESPDVYESDSTEVEQGEVVVYPEDSIEFQCGLWYSPYVKIYSIGGDNRIAEISTYPRAYKDLTPHVYTENVSFIVTEDDLNRYTEEGEFIYMDSKEQIFRISENATHYVGDPLPGVFPLWVESEDIPFDSSGQYHIFPISAIPGPIFDVCNPTIKVGDRYLKLSESLLNTIREGLEEGEIILPYEVSASEKVIIRIQYKRIT